MGEEPVDDPQDVAPVSVPDDPGDETGSPQVSAPADPPAGVEAADERQAVTPRDVEVMVGAVEAAAAAEVVEQSLDDEESNELATPHSRIVTGELPASEPTPPEPDPAEPDPTEPDSTEPDSTEPDPTEPDPAASDSEPTGPGPTEPAPVDPWADRAVSLFDDEALIGETHPTDELEPIRLDEPAPEARRRRPTAPSADQPEDAPPDAAPPSGHPPSDPAQQPELTLDPEADQPQDDPLRSTAQMAAILEEFEGRDERS